MERSKLSERIRQEIFDDLFVDVNFEAFWRAQGHQFPEVDKEVAKTVWDALHDEVYDLVY